MTTDIDARHARKPRHCAIAPAIMVQALAIMVPERAHANEPPPAAVELSGGYTVDILSTARGGLRHDTRLMGLFELGATVHGDSFGLDNLSLNATLQAVHGGGFTDEVVGDVHGVSNIDAPKGIRPLEAYAALRFGNRKQGVVKAGLIDLNGDFDVQEVGATFINSSFGIGPDFSQSGLNGPSIFPTTASAITVEWAEGPVTARVGLFDGVAGDPDRPRRTIVRFPGDTGLLTVGELDFAIADKASFQIGGWRYSRRFDAIEENDPDGGPRRLSGNHGFYAQVEGALAERGERTLDAWLRLGTANGRINPIAFYAGGGVTYGAEDSRTGLAFAYARLGDPSVRAWTDSGLRPDRGETVIELTHSQQLLDRLRVQPNVQYVINPGWNPAIRNALITGVRIELSIF